MTSPDPDIDILSAAMLAGGKSALEVAEFRIATLLEARAAIATREPRGLPPLPAWPDTGDDAVARKILGLLLDAGWTPPSGDVVQAAAQRSREYSSRFDAWWVALPEADKRRAMDHYEHTCEFPDDLRPPS